MSDSEVQSHTSPELNNTYFLPGENLQDLLDVLIGSGFQIIGPTLEQESIAYAPIESTKDLPQGWTDRQEPGLYRIQKRDDDAYFGYNVGPRSWKQFLFPPRLTVSQADRDDNGNWSFSEHQELAPKMAFLGVRSCELEAIRIQDKVFLHGPYVDPDYQRRRENILIVAVNCTQAASTCFCTSTKTGPECCSGFDLALTETSAGFLIETGSITGLEIAEELKVRQAAATEIEAGKKERAKAVAQITKQMDTTDLPVLLKENLEHPRWSEVASRCLSCTNCTMVCPTCFCSTVSEISDLAGDHVTRERTWDSCFNLDFSYMNGGVVRDSIRNRYRQWMTHKLSSWHDQFGESGCVGCGRCISWCPVGIDLTEEVAAIREEPK